MNAAMSYGSRFLVDDPNWAIDFAPNGRFQNCLSLPGRFLIIFKARYSSSTRPSPGNDTQSKGVKTQTHIGRLTLYSTLEEIAEHGAKAFYEGEMGMRTSV
jgi:hypothetical protein